MGVLVVVMVVAMVVAAEVFAAAGVDGVVVRALGDENEVGDAEVARQRDS